MAVRARWISLSLLTTAVIVSAGTWWLARSREAEDDEPVDTCGRGCYRYNHVALLTIVSAQRAFRKEVVAGEGPAFWRNDVAGLYTTPRSSSPGAAPLELIERSVALADAAPVCDVSRLGERTPKGGFWYRALRFSDEGDKPDTNRFAACAYPAEYRTETRHSYIIDHEGRLFRKNLKGECPGYFPSDPLAEGWRRIE